MKVKLHQFAAALGALALGFSAQAAIVVVTSDIATNATWTSTNEYVLQGSTSAQGVIRVLPGVTLTIQGGTIVRGQPRTNASNYDAGSLAVLRGGKIVATGSSGNPVIFTTAAVDNDQNGEPDNFTRNGLPGSGATASVFADRYNAGTFVQFWDNLPKTAPKPPTMTGLWGGVILCGKAPVNWASTADTAVTANPNGNPATPYVYTKPVVEGLTSPDYGYGSDWGSSETLPSGGPAYTATNAVDPDDNSGELTYVSIRHGGIQLAADNEINGLTLAGVGRGTKIEYIEVWGNEDDGIEIFGGNVNLSHIAIFSTKDDGLDIDQGYSGQIQFALVVGGSFMDKLCEWDGDDADESSAGKAAKANFEPRGSWEVRNLTLVRLPTLSNQSGAGEAMRIRRNASCKVYNVIISNLGSATAITAQTTFWNLLSNITHDSSAGTPLSLSSATVSSAISTASPGFGTITTATTSYTGDTSSLAYLTFLNPRPGNSGGSAAAYLANSAPPSGNLTFFKSAPYRGAFSNSGGALWTTGWTAANKRGALPDNG
jgi:hypothetical protein